MTKGHRVNEASAFLLCYLGSFDAGASD